MTEAAAAAAVVDKSRLLRYVLVIELNPASVHCVYVSAPREFAVGVQLSQRAIHHRLIRASCSLHSDRSIAQCTV